MNHVKWAFAILIVIISISVFSEYTVKMQRSELIGVLYELKSSAERGDTESSEKLCDVLNDTWHKAETVVSYTVPMDKVSQAEQSICRLKSLLTADSDEFEAEIMTAIAICSRM